MTRLPDGAEARLDALAALVAADPSAPTTVRDARAIAERHIADSLSGLEIPAVRAALRIADLGAGAGFPGLVLAAALPEAEVVLVESAGRKAAWIERAAAQVGIVNVRVAPLRAEELDPGPGFDVVTARALAALPVLVEYAAPLLRLGGRLVAWKGERDAEEEAWGDRAAALAGLSGAEVRPVQPFPTARHRHLHVYSKVSETPDRLPRRPGMAVKRPLGR